MSDYASCKKLLQRMLGHFINGPPIGTNTTGQEAQGPHCVTGGSH